MMSSDSYSGRSLEPGATSLRGALGARQVLASLLRHATRSLGATRGFLALVDQETGELVIEFTEGEGWTEENRRRRLRIGQQEGRGITAFVAASGRPYRTGNVLKDPYYLPFFDDVMSALAVPLLDSFGRVLGVINIESDRENAFGECEEHLLQAIGSQAALTLCMADHQARERAIIELGNEMALTGDAESLMQKVVHTAAVILRAEDCSIFLLEPGADRLVLAASRGPLADMVGRATYPVGEGLTGWTAGSGTPVRTADPRQDPRWRGLHPEFPPEQIGAFMSVPIKSPSGLLGVLRVVRRKRSSMYFHHEFTDADEDLLVTLANQIGVALEISRLMERLAHSERMAAWGEMSARSAHMIGNKVFAIKGYVNELEYALTKPEVDFRQVGELLGGLKRSVFSVEEILLEFRDFVKATRLQPGPVDVNEVLRRSLAEGMPKDSGVQIEVNLADGLPVIYGDAGKLDRCFAELIENAVKAQPAGGVLKVSTGLAGKDDLVLMKCRAPGPVIKVEFSDGGPGVPAQDKKRIFDPFFTTRSKGMGLGLSIVKGIVEAHRGTIAEVGEPGLGARFVILLPANQDAVCHHQEGQGGE
ncbi:MAG: GAF domain-containing protein [Armatimonadota bacterium]